MGVAPPAPSPILRSPGPTPRSLTAWRRGIAVRADAPVTGTGASAVSRPRGGLAVNPGVAPDGTAPAALRCCVVQQTRLDTARIRAARRVIDPVFLDTPLYRCEALEPGLGCKVSIKLETANPVRSFKARGTEVIASLLAGNGSRAVVCASAGNLGSGVHFMPAGLTDAVA